MSKDSIKTDYLKEAHTAFPTPPPAHRPQHLVWASCFLATQAKAETRTFTQFSFSDQRNHSDSSADIYFPGTKLKQKFLRGWLTLSEKRVQQTYRRKVCPARVKMTLQSSKTLPPFEFCFRQSLL